MSEKTLKLRSGRKGARRPGHPWIYKEQILKSGSIVKPGDIVAVVDNENKYIGRGYYNPRSEISIRLLTFNDEAINKEFFHKRIKEAVGKRSPLPAITNAYRAIFSEGDSLPGFIVDVYADTAVFQILTLGMEKFKDVLIEGLKSALPVKYIYEKSESPFRMLEGLRDIGQWRGDKGSDVIEIFEGKIRFLVDIEKGHKTGFYLDQRKSRLGMESISKGKKVLDMFCYSGGFSVSSAVYGAASVRGIDVNEVWREMARKNALLNNVSDRSEFIKGDAFSVLRNIHDSGEKFDIIIIDPPSFLRKKESLISASKGYKDINLMAMKALEEGGILCTFSCSYNMPNRIFSDILRGASLDAKKRYEILKRCHQAEDHPIVKAIPETEYLKGYFLKVFSE